MRLTTHIGGLATLKTAIRPNDTADSAGSFVTTGQVVIDRKDYTSALLKFGVGAATGAPATIAVDAKLQHSVNSNGSSPADVASGAITQLTAINTGSIVDIGDLTGLNRYILVTYKVALTGGASPKIGISADILLGGPIPSKPVHAAG